jgi:alpha-amylase
MKKIKILSLLVVLFCTCQSVFAQDFMLQGWYWNYPGTADGYVWADTLNAKAQALANAGFTYVWLPPLSRASFGQTSNGYDPKDLFDLGEFGGGPTRFGTRTDVNDLIATFNTYGLKAVADMIYNHRDGGKAENNPSVEGWIENYTATKVNAGDQPYPSDRFRCILPIGGATGRGAGTYYFKFKSASEHSNFYNKPYKAYIQTNVVGYQGLPNGNESEPNGGGGCGEPNNAIQLGVDMYASIDGSGCKIDEFALTVSSGQFNSAGDTLYIYMQNRNGGEYSDQYPYEIWYNGSNHEGDMRFQTYTDFTSVASDRGDMNHSNFKPNGNPTQLSGDWDYMYFFYDYDQFVPSTKDTLFAWTRWMWSNAGMRGLRMDAVKHFTPEFVGDLLDNLNANGMNPGMVVGEWFDSNSFILKDWVDDVKSYMDAGTQAAIKPRVFDFSLRDALEKACDQFGYDVRNVFNASIVDAQSVSGDYAVTFVNNHDFRDPGQPVDNDPILAYAYTLTNNQLGVASVFYPDYYSSLKSKIDQLIEIHKNYIYGATSRDYLNRFSTPYSSNYISGAANTSLIYQLRGAVSGRDVIVAINFSGSTLKVDHGVNTTSLPIGATLVEVVGNSPFPYAVVSGSSQIYMEIPARSYGVWVEDAGSWAQATVNGLGSTYTFNEIDMLDKDTGWAVATSGKIAKTANGGMTWSAVTSGTSNALYGVKAVDANTIIVVGASNTIRRTTNGGSSWTSVAPSMSPTPIWRNVDGIGNTLYAVGYVTSGSRRVRVVRSTDGGVTWTRIDGGTMGSTSTTSSTAFYGIDMVTADVVYICGTYGTGGNSIYRTTNGTNASPTWSGTSTASPFYSIEMIDSSWGYVVGSSSKYYQTTNGTTFSSVASSGLPSGMSVWDVSWNANTQRLYLAGYTGSSGSYVPRIYRTGTMSSSSASDVVTAMTVNLPSNSRLYALDSETSSAAAGGDKTQIAYYGALGVVKQAAPVEETNSAERITHYELFANYPNPFNPTTTITYQIPQAGRVSLKIYNMLGQVVRILVDAEVAAGLHATVWDGKNSRGEPVASGVYIYRLEAGEVVKTKKMLLTK